MAISKLAKLLYKIADAPSLGNTEAKLPPGYYNYKDAMNAIGNIAIPETKAKLNIPLPLSQQEQQAKINAQYAAIAKAQADAEKAKVNESILRRHNMGNPSIAAADITLGLSKDEYDRFKHITSENYLRGIREEAKARHGTDYTARSVPRSPVPTTQTIVKNND